MTENLERLPITPDNIGQFFREYPDHKQRYEFALPYVSGKIVADIACGAGYGCNILAARAKEVFGFDIDAATVEHAGRHFSGPNCTFLHAKAFAGPFDVVTSFETIEHMTEADGDRFLKSIRSNLSKNGVLILSTPLNTGLHKENVTPFHLREYDNDELANKLSSNGFRVVEWWGQSNAVSRSAGRGASGLAIKTGAHRIAPPWAREMVKRALFGKVEMRGREGVELRRDALDGAFVQMAVCRLA